MSSIMSFIRSSLGLRPAYSGKLPLFEPLPPPPPMKIRPTESYSDESEASRADFETRITVQLPPCEYPYEYFGLYEGEHLFGEAEHHDEGSFPVPCPYYVGSMLEVVGVRVERVQDNWAWVVELKPNDP